jgi:hypothetical protein
MTQEINFESLKLPISESIKLYSEEQQKEIYQYLNEMTHHERIGYEIAFNHLGTSFNVYRSNGFIEWKHKKYEKK